MAKCYSECIWQPKPILNEMNASFRFTCCDLYAVRRDLVGSNILLETIQVVYKSLRILSFIIYQLLRINIAFICSQD